jgi:hypothetical protein
LKRELKELKKFIIIKKKKESERGVKKVKKSLF